MPTNIGAYHATCQSCGKQFKINECITTVVNLDISGFEKKRFTAGNLNKISCPFCNAEFTYEVSMIIFSESLRFACLVMPNLDYIDKACITPPPHIIMPRDFSYRLVRYQHEALEKYKILSNGFSDILIEYIKLIKFSDMAAMPFDEKSIVFDGYNDGIFTFKLTDFNDKVKKIYKSEFDLTLVPRQILSKALSCDKWQIIDRISIREEL